MQKKKKRETYHTIIVTHQMRCQSAQTNLYTLHDELSNM